MILWKCTVANAMLPLVIFRFQRVKQLIFLILIAANPHVRRSCRLHATQPVPFNLAKEYIRTMELVYRLYKGKQEYYSIVVESALSCNKLITFKKEKNRNPTCGSTFMSISPSPFGAVIASCVVGGNMDTGSTMEAGGTAGANSLCKASRSSTPAAWFVLLLL